MESKTIDVNFDSLKHDFIRLTNQLRIISCTGEHINKNKKNHNFFIPRKYLISSSKIRLNNVVVQEIVNNIIKIYVDDLHDGWNFFDQPLETKFKFIKIVISSIMETILLFVDKIIKKLKNQHLSKQILDFVLKFLHDRQKYTDMLSNECVLFKSKLSILEQTIKIKYNIEIKTIQNMLMPHDIESLKNDLYRSKLVSAPVVSQEIVRAPVISLNSPQNDFVSVSVPSINPSVSGNPPRQSLLKRLKKKIKKTFTRRRGGKKKKKKRKTIKRKKRKTIKRKKRKLRKQKK